MLAKQEITRLLETLQKQQQQFTELADHVQLDASIPVTFTKVFLITLIHSYLFYEIPSVILKKAGIIHVHCDAVFVAENWGSSTEVRATVSYEGHLVFEQQNHYAVVISVRKINLTTSVAFFEH